MAADREVAGLAAVAALAEADRRVAVLEAAAAVRQVELQAALRELALARGQLQVALDRVLGPEEPVAVVVPLEPVSREVMKLRRFLVEY